MIFFVCFHMGFTKLGNLLKTRSSLVLKVPNKPTTLSHAEFTQHLKVLHSSHSTSPQIVTGRWNLGNLGQHHSVDLRLHMGWKTLAHHAGRPCCRPCRTPATFSIYWGLSRWWLSAPWGSWWWWWRTWRAGWCQDQAPEGNYTSRENYVKAKVPECGILASKTSDQVERHQVQEQQPGAVPHLQHLESFT